MCKQCSAQGFSVGVGGLEEERTGGGVNQRGGGIRDEVERWMKLHNIHILFVFASDPETPLIFLLLSMTSLIILISLLFEN